MKIYDVEQGSPEWLTLRAGIPTASEFHRILTPGGRDSAQSEGYMLQLLAERYMGHPIAQSATGWMTRGQEVEPDAVADYEFARDLTTVPIGFLTNDAGTIGASPDRGVGDEGLLEIKSPSEMIHMGYLLEDGRAYADHRVQVQGQLWVAERQWVDLMSFHPELPTALVRIHRDDIFIQKLSVAVTSFSNRLEERAAAMARAFYRKIERPAYDIVAAMRDSLIQLKGERHESA